MLAGRRGPFHWLRPTGCQRMPDSAGPAVAELAERLADVPAPAGPTPSQLGTTSAFISLTSLRDTLPEGES